MKAFVSKCISCTMCKCCWTCICPGVSVGPGSLEASWTREDLVVTTRNPSQHDEILCGNLKENLVLPDSPCPGKRVPFKSALPKQSNGTDSIDS